MSLTIKKVRGSDNYQFSWTSEGKVVQWIVNGSDVDPTTLLDIVNTAAPECTITIPPTIPMYPVGTNPQFTPPPSDWDRFFVKSAVAGTFVPDTSNAGAEAADRAARDEEMRLRNMGSALASGVGLPADAIPVVDSDRNDMGPVNWSA